MIFIKIKLYKCTCERDGRTVRRYHRSRKYVGSTLLVTSLFLFLPRPGFGDLLTSHFSPLSTFSGSFFAAVPSPVTWDSSPTKRNCIRRAHCRLNECFPQPGLFELFLRGLSAQYSDRTLSLEAWNAVSELLSWGTMQRTGASGANLGCIAPPKELPRDQVLSLRDVMREVTPLTLRPLAPVSLIRPRACHMKSTYQAPKGSVWGKLSFSGGKLSFSGGNFELLGSCFC